MKLNNFSVRVYPGKETSNGYVEMNEGDQYSLFLRNFSDRRCSAEVWIDGKRIARWVLNAKQNVEIQGQPLSDGTTDGRFTFYKLGSKDGNRAGLQRNEDLGLIAVEFFLEHERPLIQRGPTLITGQTTGFTRGGGSTRGYSAGGTGLSGHSNQRHQYVDPIIPDDSSRTLISLRLVTSNSNEPRPLRPSSNPVPPPVA